MILIQLWLFHFFLYLHLLLTVPPRIVKLGPASNLLSHWIPFYVTGMPQPSVTFYHGTKLLVPGDHISIHYKEYFNEYEKPYYPWFHAGFIIIQTAPSHFDNGNYTLVAENVVGVDVKWGMQIFIDVPEKPIRLVDGDHSSSGRLDIYYNDEWGSICDEKFDRNDAEVACRHLGFLYAAGIIKDGSFTRGKRT